MKFLIDECLSPSLAALARKRGYPESTHVTWLELRAREDWALVRRAVADGYVLVTNDRADFTPLVEREHRHPGLVCITVAHGLMSLDVQTRLFEHALARLGGQGPRRPGPGDRTRRRFEVDFGLPAEGEGRVQERRRPAGERQARLRVAVIAPQELPSAPHRRPSAMPPPEPPPG